jgi:hypothetical protein
LTFAIAGPPAHGTLSGSGSAVVYTPDPDFHGEDSFTFIASDGASTSAPATVAITVDPVNDAPVASDASVSAASGVAEPIALRATDPDSHALTYVLVTQPAHGTVSLVGSTATYTSEPGFTGTDSFGFAVHDGTVLSTTAIVTIDVRAAAPAIRLSLADDARRIANVRSLDGAIVTGGASAFIFVDPSGSNDVANVTFELDGTPFAVDAAAPFDFAGTTLRRPCPSCAPDAIPFESNLLDLGEHQIRAHVAHRNGTRTVLVATFTVADTVPHSLMVSSTASRAEPVAIDGALLSGKQYPFFGPAGDPIAGLAAIIFAIDGRPAGIDLSAPYDVGGTNRNGTASPIDTRRLRNGQHQLTAIVVLDGGRMLTYEASFRVQN